MAFDIVDALKKISYLIFIKMKQEDYLILSFFFKIRKLRLRMAKCFVQSHTPDGQWWQADSKSAGLTVTSTAICPYRCNFSLSLESFHMERQCAWGKIHSIQGLRLFLLFCNNSRVMPEFIEQLTHCTFLCQTKTSTYPFTKLFCSIKFGFNSLIKFI